MLFVTGTVGKLKIRVHSVVEGDLEDAKSTAHVLAAHGIENVAVMSGETAGGKETGRAVYKVEADGYGHPVQVAA